MTPRLADAGLTVSGGLTGVTMCGILFFRAPTLFTGSFLFRDQEQPYTFSGCNKSPLVDPTQKGLVESWRSQRYPNGTGRPVDFFCF